MEYVGSLAPALSPPRTRSKSSKVKSKSIPKKSTADKRVGKNTNKHGYINREGKSTNYIGTSKQGRKVGSLSKRVVSGKSVLLPPSKDPEETSAKATKNKPKKKGKEEEDE